MIIHEPVIVRERDRVVASARVETDADVADAPEHLCFSFPERHVDRVSDRADGRLSAMVLMAMRWGEDIEVRGAVSPRLLENIERFQRTFHEWSPELYRIADMTATDPVEPPTRANGEVLCAFSGGVDSMYSLWSHLPENDAGPNRITHGLFVHGFDIPLDDVVTFEDAVDYEQLFDDLGMELLSARTNHQEFDSRPQWGMVHGPVVVGAAQVIGVGARRLYVPASFTPETLLPWGSDPRTDPLLSTESLEVVHEGAISRAEKTEVLSRWPATYTTLRVCWHGEGSGVSNCSECEKCLRTTATLDIAGHLTDYETFGEAPTGSQLRRLQYTSPTSIVFAHDIIRHAAAHRRWDVAANIAYARLRSAVLWRARWAARRARSALGRVAGQRTTAR